MNAEKEYCNLSSEGAELAARILDLPEICTEAQVEEYIEGAWGISLEQFEAVAEALLEATPIMKNSLSGKWYHVFGYRSGEAWVAVAKKQA